MTPTRTTANVLINPAALRVALSRRGWNFGDLRKVAGLGSSTISLINQGRPISPHVAMKIARAVAETEADQTLTAMLDLREFRNSLDPFGRHEASPDGETA